MIKIAAEISTSAQQRVVGMDEMTERGSEAVGTLTAGNGGVMGVAVTVTSGCVLLIRAIFGGSSGTRLIRDVSFLGVGTVSMREVSFLGCAAGPGRVADAVVIGAAGGGGSGIFAIRGRGGTDAKLGAGFGIIRGGSGGVIGSFAGEAGIGGGGTLRWGETIP